MPAKKKTTTKKPAKKSAKKTIKKASATKKTVAKKKVVKKIPVKKVTPKKKTSATKKPTRKQKPKLVYASNETSFWVNNGPVLNSLPALKDALAVITVEQFEFHAKGSQNDFAVWVEAILLDKNCAKELKKAKTQKTAVKKVADAIKKYKR